MDTPTHGTSRGIPLSEDLLEQLADEAERGYPPERLVRRGRPPLGDGPSEVVPVRLDPDLRLRLDDRAEHEATTASELIRRALRAYLDAA
jgi:Ribbon-helix-helix protein, copG family